MSVTLKIRVNKKRTIKDYLDADWDNNGNGYQILVCSLGILFWLVCSMLFSYEEV